MLITASTLPPEVRALPALAAAPFMDAANRAHEYGMPRAESIRIGMAAARYALETEHRDEARVERVERVGLRLDASTIEKRPNGMVAAWGIATRTGVLDYDDPSMPGGIFREYRPPDEVFNADSLASLDGVPFTILHPDVPVDTANARDLTHGWVMEVRAEGELVAVRVMIATDEALRAIREDGIVELSCGYTARLEAVEGVSPAGEPFHAIQRDIRYNHLALVQMARAGHVARFRFDGARIQRAANTRGPTPMNKFKLRFDGRTLEAPLFLLPGLRASAVKLDGAGNQNGRYRQDLKTGRMVIEVEGEEPAELVLPMPTIEEVLGMLGASTEGAENAPAEEPAGDEGGEPMDPAAGPPAPVAPVEEDSRMDAAAVAKIVDAKIAEERTRADAASRYRARVEREASRVLDAGYRYDSADVHGIQAATVAKVLEDRADEARELAAKARKGDARADGKLDALFSIACDQAAETEQARADAASETGDTGNAPAPAGGGSLILDSRNKFLRRLREGTSAVDGEGAANA